MDGFEEYWKWMTAMRRVKEQAEKLAQPFCQAHGLTQQQLRVLLALHMEGAQTMSELAKTTCVAGGNNSTLCKRMDQLGWVARRRGTEDERRVIVCLTPEGSRLAEEFAEYCRAQMAREGVRVSPQDKKVIRAGLDTMAQVWEENNQEAKTI